MPVEILGMEITGSSDPGGDPGPGDQLRRLRLAVAGLVIVTAAALGLAAGLYLQTARITDLQTARITADLPSARTNPAATPPARSLPPPSFGRGGNASNARNAPDCCRLDWVLESALVHGGDVDLLTRPARPSLR